MNKLLLGSFFAVTLALCETTLAGSEEQYDSLGVVAIVSKPRELRGTYENDIKSLRAQLGTKPDATGYNWKFPMQSDAALHLSLLTFGKKAYASSHVSELQRILSSTALESHNGYFLRPELWMHNANPDGKVVSSTHWVHPDDLTLTEKQDDTTQYFDPAVRSLDKLTEAESADFGHIVLRYATMGTLSDSVTTLVSTLQNRAATSPICRELEEGRDKFVGSNLVSHLTIARVIRCLGDQAGIQQEIKGKYSVDLRHAFEGFRANFQTNATMPNPKNPSLKVIPYDVTEVHITSGVRENRKVLHTISSK